MTTDQVARPDSGPEGEPDPGRLGRRSIRVRLTAAIVGLTALMAIGAVWLGLERFEAAVVDRAIDQRGADFAGFESRQDLVDSFSLPAFFEEFEGLEDFEDFEEFEELEELELEELEELEEFLAVDGQIDTPFLAVEAMLALSELEQAGLRDLIFEAFADDGVLQVLLFNGRVAAVEGAQPVVTTGELTAVAPGSILVPQEDLLELAAVTREQFVIGDFGDDFDRQWVEDQFLADVFVIDGEVFVGDGFDAVIFEDVLSDEELDQLLADEVATVDGEAAEIGEDRVVEPVLLPVGDLSFGLLIDVTDELAAIGSIRWSLWAAAAGLVALAGVATWFLTGRALGPVGAMTRRVDAISETNLHGRVPDPGTGDEIGMLARTMNRMLARLERADLRRRQFVSDASHELRTPVAVLRSEAEVAARAPETTSVSALASVVLGETSRLETLVEDLLVLTRTDEGLAANGAGRAGNGDPLGEIDADDVVLEEAARARRLPVDHRAVSAGRIRGGPEDLARVVRHLLDNAARHGRSAVAVGVRTEHDEVRIWVDDDGAGIDPADRSRVFERFVRLDEARGRDQGGAGLGLAVVAETVTAMGGTVEVSDSPLGGARFEIRLPAA